MCEDSIAVNISTKAIAIADGVGGSLFPEYFSRRLTSDFVDNPDSYFDCGNSRINHEKMEEYKTGYEEYADMIIDRLQGVNKLALKAKRELKVNFALVACSKKIRQNVNTGD